MPSPKYRLILAPEARVDRANITKYTVRTWGKEQATKYNAKLRDAFGAIQNNPRIGRTHPQLSVNILFYHVERHNIFYRVNGLEIEVLRVLHVAQDAPQRVN